MSGEPVWRRRSTSARPPRSAIAFLQEALAHRHDEVHRPPQARPSRASRRARPCATRRASIKEATLQQARCLPRAARRQRRAARRTRPLGGHGGGGARDRPPALPGQAACGWPSSRSRWRPRRSTSTRRSSTRASTPVETDLGEYIVQLAHERPSHIIAPGDPQDEGQVAELISAVAGKRLARRPRGADGGGARPAPRGVPRRPTWASRAPTSPSPRPARVVLVTNEGNGRMSRRCRGSTWRSWASRRSCRLDDRPRGVPRAAGAQRDGPEAVVLHDAGARPAAGRASSTGRTSSTSSWSTTARARQIAGPLREALLLHPLRRLPQRLPGLPPDRRPRLRPHRIRARSASSSPRCSAASGR